MTPKWEPHTNVATKEILREGLFLSQADTGSQNKVFPPNGEKNEKIFVKKKENSVVISTNGVKNCV